MSASLSPSATSVLAQRKYDVRTQKRTSVWNRGGALQLAELSEYPLEKVPQPSEFNDVLGGQDLAH